MKLPAHRRQRTQHLCRCPPASAVAMTAAAPAETVPPSEADNAAPSLAAAPLRGEFISRATFANPHAHIPAQCYIDTSHGTQNACLFCHTDGVAELGLGNTDGASATRCPELQADTPSRSTTRSRSTPASPPGSTPAPRGAARRADATGDDPARWDMQAWVREDNWSAAFAQRKGFVADLGQRHGRPLPRLFRARSRHLPAQDDGFVRSATAARGLFTDAHGRNWLAGGELHALRHLHPARGQRVGDLPAPGRALHEERTRRLRPRDLCRQPRPRRTQHPGPPRRRDPLPRSRRRRANRPRPVPARHRVRPPAALCGRRGP